jgi:hypothetical protein
VAWLRIGQSRAAFTVPRVITLAIACIATATWCARALRRFPQFGSVAEIHHKFSTSFPLGSLFDAQIDHFFVFYFKKNASINYLEAAFFFPSTT